MDKEMIIKGCENWVNNHKDENFLLTYSSVVELLAALKEQDTKHGKWRYCEDASGQDGYQCSECGFFEPWYYKFEDINFITDYQFCPSCGSLMQEGW